MKLILKQTIPLLIAATLCLTGCVPALDNSGLQSLTIPDQFSNAEKSVLDQETILFEPELQQFIHEALTRNYSLKAMVKNLDQVKALHRITKSDRYPHVQADLSYNRTKSQLGLVDNSYISSEFKAGAQVSWEIDLWGKIRDRTNSSILEVEGSMMDLHAARLSLACQIGQAWYQAITAQLLHDQAEEVSESFFATFKAVNERYSNGLASGLDLSMAKTAYADSKTTLQQTQLDKQRSLLELQVLAGLYPDSVIDLPESFPPRIPRVPLKVPADLITKRPDIMALSRRLEAAGYSWRAVSKERLPSITLSASAGLSGDRTDTIFKGSNILWQLIGGITQPVFEGGKLLAAADAKEAAYQQLHFEFQHLLLNSFREVEEALYSTSVLQEQYKSAEETARLAESSWTLAKESYQLGGTDVLTILLNQRQHLQSQTALITTQNLVFQNSIKLILALGQGLPTGNVL